MKPSRAGEKRRAWWRAPGAARSRAAVLRHARPLLERLEHRLAPAAHDTLATAIPLSFDANQQAQAAASLTDPNETDFFSLTVGTTGGLSATVTAANGNALLPRLALYGNAGQLLIEADAAPAANPTASLEQHLQPGTYYLGVSAVGGIHPSAGMPGYVLDTQFEASLPAFQPLLVGSHPQSLATGDFNNDGNLDVVTVNNASNTISVLLGNGDGTFRPAVSYPVGAAPFGVAVGKLTSDGNNDIVVTDNGSNNVAVLLGNGDGTFQPAVFYPVGRAPTGVTVGDFDNDGHLDIVTANSEVVPTTGLPAGPGTVSVWLGNGNGTFRPAGTFLVGGTLPGPAPIPFGLAPYAIAAGDFNHDNNLDLVTANYADGTVSVLLGDGHGNFGSPAPYQVGSFPTSLAVGDLTGAGYADDIVVANSSFNVTTVVQSQPGAGTVSVLLANGDGTFRNASGSPYAVGIQPTSVALGDFSGEGHLDIAVSDPRQNSVSVLLGNGDGTFQLSSAYPSAVGPLAVVVGEFTHDGSLDIATADQGSNTVSVFLGNGHGSFLTPSDLVSPIGVAAGDFNGDGNLDMAVANYANDTVSVLLGNGDGTFQPPVSYSVGQFPIGLAVGKFNGDGILDIVVADSAFSLAAHEDVGEGMVSVLLGRGDGTFLPAKNYPVGAFAPYGVAVGDVNGDNQPDIVTANDGEPGSTGPGSVSVLLGNSDGTFQPAVTYPVGSFPIGVALGDFNHDGHTDIVAANSAYDESFSNLTAIGTVSVLLGDGTGKFTPDGFSTPGLPPGTFAVGGLAPSGVAVGDFTNDGYPDDIVTANNATGTVSVLLGNGKGNFQPPVTYDLGSNSFPLGVAVSQLSGANSPDDIVTANSGYSKGFSLAAPGSVSVLFGNGDGTFTPAVSYSAGIGTYEVAIGDFTGGGSRDIVATNNGSNTVSVLLNQGDHQFLTTTPRGDIPIRNIPFLQDLTGARQADGTPIPDEVILANSGAIFFRLGSASDPDQFAPPMTINPSDPARDMTLFQTGPGSWAVAAVDEADNAVSIYTWDAALNQGRGGFLRSLGFATGDIPVRIAAADLTGDGLDDLVVTNELDDSVTIAFQTSPGRFGSPLTRPAGAGPSDITFQNEPGQRGPNIVVSDQDSGDFTVLRNDATAAAPPTFTNEARYRAGAGLFDIGINPNTGAQMVLSELQTVGVAAGAFDDSGGDDLVLLNGGTGSFTLFPDAGAASFPASLSDTFYLPVGARPLQVVSLTLPGEVAPSLAVLMGGLNQIWVFPNRGALYRDSDALFAPPITIDTGNDPTALSVAQVNGRLALLVGNAYGDVLTLLADGDGRFAPDHANLQSAPVAVGTIAGTGQQYAVVADQNLDQVWLYPTLTDGGKKIISGAGQGVSSLPAQFAPGAVQTFSVPGDLNPYLAVANSLSNDVLIYHYDPATTQFDFVEKYDVGDDPVSITVSTINDWPDLAVVNHGSNDISMLMGAVDPTTGLWTATSYQRVSSGGSGPVGVSFVNGGSQGPDLLATNGDGTVALVPGIGSVGQGSGFFATPEAHSWTIPAAPIGPVTDGLLPTAEGIFAVNSGHSGLTVALVLAATNLTAFGAGPGRDVVAGFGGGEVEVLAPNADGELAPDLFFQDARLTDPSAVQVVSSDGQTNIVATNAGLNSLIIFPFADGSFVRGVRSPFEPRGQSIVLQPVSEAALVLAAAVADAGIGVPTRTASAEGGSGLAALVPPPEGVVVATTLLLSGGGGESDPAAPGPDAPLSPAAGDPAPPLNDFMLGAGDTLNALRGQLREQRGPAKANEPAKPAPTPAADLDQSSRTPRGVALPPPAAGSDPAPTWSRAALAIEAGEAATPPDWAARPEPAADAAFALAPTWEERRSLLLALVLTGAAVGPLWDSRTREGGAPGSARRGRGEPLPA
jgi:hypothetical protein